MPESSSSDRVLLFDGVCNLCNGVVQFVIRHDKKENLKFASLQSTYGQATLRKLNLPTNELHSFIYFRDGTYHQQSTGILFLMRDLGGWFRFVEIGWILPRFFRDWIYHLVAVSRYSIFGKKDECYLPTPELDERFVDDLLPS